MLGKYQTIKKEDIIAAFQKYFMPLFDPASSVAIVVTATKKVESIVDGLSYIPIPLIQRKAKVEVKVRCRRHRGP